MTGIDHAVIVVADLEAARARFQRLGFQVTARADHGHTGTANHLAVFGDSYIELLGIRVPGPDNELFQQLLSVREGYWLTALCTIDALAEHGQLAAAGIETEAPLKWSRALNVANPAEVSFSTLFIPPDATPQAGFFFCQHHDRGTVLDPELTGHANGALDLAGAIVVAESLPTLQEPYENLFGAGAMETAAGHSILRLGRQIVSFESRQAFTSRFNRIQLPRPLKGPNFAALEISVADLTATAAALSSNGVHFEADPGDGRLWVDPAEACGVAISFNNGA